MAPTAEEIASQIRQLAPASYAEELIASLRPSVRIGCVAEDEEWPLGCSRFGGWPDVPRAFDWPTCVALSNPGWWRGYYEDKYKRPLRDDEYIEGGLRTVGELVNRPMYSEPKPLSLLAQLNLAEVPRDLPLDLPARGQLLFFCDTGDELVFGGATEPHDRWRVYYFDVPPDALVRTPGPADDPDNPPAVRAVRFAPEWTVDEDLRYRASDDETAAFERVRHMLVGDWGRAQHRLLGHPQPIQSASLGPNAEVTLRQLGFGEGLPEADAVEAKRAWRSLLQLDGDDDLRWDWGDAGRFHFAVRDEDLKARRFDRVMVELQGH
jgi:uncharacterized protein YwqG